MKLLVAFVVGLALGTGGALLISDDDSSDEDGTAEPAGARLLFTQTARSGSIATGADGKVTLTLRGVARRTTRYTDRPLRVADTIPTEHLTRDFDALFGDEPPNASLSLPHPTPRTIVLELLSVSAGPANTVRYEGQVLGRATHTTGRQTFVEPVLNIDDVAVGAATVTGTVREYGGGTLLGANVELTGAGIDLHATTDADGHYALSVPATSLESGASFTVAARAGFHRGAKSTVSGLAPGAVVTRDFALYELNVRG